MIDELKDIECELNRLKKRVRRMIELLEKRRVRLDVLSEEDVIAEAGDRTLPATDIAKLLDEAEPKNPKR